jgi:hypothetical protein
VPFNDIFVKLLEFVPFTGGGVNHFRLLAIGNTLNMCQYIDCDKVGSYNGKAPWRSGRSFGHGHFDLSLCDGQEVWS